jgi:hypothetical protein
MSSITSYIPTKTVQDVDPRFENVPDDLVDMNGNYGVTNHHHNPEQRSSSHQPNAKKFRLKLSERLHWTAVLAFISYLILLISFASPYWLSSYKFTDSTFKRLGLWDFCFQDYRHPSYQYDTKFTGCHWIYSPIYTNIRDWLQPTWFMFVQAVMTIALCVSTLGLLAVSIIFMHFLIQYQLIILCLTLVCHLLTTLLIFFALITFYYKAFDKSWIMYPDFNHVDWAFFFALVSMGGNGFASHLYYQEVATLKERMLRMKRLIVSTNGGRPIQGDEADSIDAVYASRTGGNNTFNQSADQETVYPHFTQV